MEVLKSVVVPLLSVLLLAGCYSGGKKSKDEKQSDQLTETNAGGQRSPDRKNEIMNRTNYHTVEIKQMKFNPAELQVTKGDTVVWINNDIVAHDVTDETAKRWTSSLIPSHASWQMVVTESSDYYCSIHVVMKGKLVVK